MLRGLAKFVAIVAAAVIGGLAIGATLAKLLGDTDSSTSGLGGSSGAPPSIVTTTTTTPSTAKKPASNRRRKPANDVRVRVVSAILHPAGSPSGRSRQRARLSVHVRVTNRGSRRFVPSRPVLVSGDVRVKTDPNQDSPATDLGALAPGATRDVTLRFETAGAVTQRLRQEPRARLIIAAKNLTTPVKLGSPVQSRS